MNLDGNRQVFGPNKTCPFTARKSNSGTNASEDNSSGRHRPSCLNVEPDARSRSIRCAVACRTYVRDQSRKRISDAFHPSWRAEDLRGEVRRFCRGIDSMPDAAQFLMHLDRTGKQSPLRTVRCHCRYRIRHGCWRLRAMRTVTTWTGRWYRPIV